METLINSMSTVMFAFWTSAATTKLVLVPINVTAPLRTADQLSGTNSLELECRSVRLQLPGRDHHSDKERVFFRNGDRVATGSDNLICETKRQFRQPGRKR